MGDFQVSGPELKKFVKIMRKRPVSFAYNPGSDNDTAYLALHRTKPPKTLGKEAKEEGEGNKHAFGTASVDGRVLVLTLDRELPAIAKKLKKYLKSQKVGLNVQVFDASGKMLESDIEELPDDPDLFGDDEEDDDGPVEAMDPIKKRVFLIERWKKIPGELNVQLGALNKRISDNVPDEDPDDFCAGVDEWMSALVTELQESLNDAIDTSINAGDHNYGAVTDAINNKLRPRVANDQLVTHFKKGDLLPGNAFEDAFSNAFDEIQKALSA